MRGTATAIVLLLVCVGIGLAQDKPQSVKEIRRKAVESSLKISGDVIHTWPEGPTRVFTVRGDARVEQGEIILAADRMVIWFNEQEAQKTGRAKIRVYAESAATSILGEEVKRCEQFLGSFESDVGLVLNGEVLTHAYRRESPLLKRALKVVSLGEPEYMSGEKVPPDVITPPKPKPYKGVEIRADSFDSWEEKDGTRVVVLKGNVNIVRGKYEISADRIVLWFSTSENEKGGMAGAFREVYAEGDVTLYQDQDMLQAEKVFQNRIENKGLLENARITMHANEKDLPIIFGGKEVRQIDEDRFDAEKGFVTTDDFGRPHFRFQSQQMRLIQSKDSRVVNATHNTFRVGELPVMYWPFLSKDLKDDSWFIKSVRFGSSRDLGSFILTDWDFYDFGIYRNDWSDVTLDMDYYSKRGPAFGVDAEYRRDNYFGYLNTYYIHDTATFDRPSIPVPENDRGRTLWRHRQFLPKGFRLDAEVSWLSDRNFLREYFEEEFQTGKEQETMVYLRKLDDNKGLTLTEKHRINRFQTTVEQTPRARFDIIGEPIPIGNTYLNFTQTNTLANQRLRYSNVLGIDSPPRTWRFDSRSEIRMPMRVGFANLSPFVGAEVTAYDHTNNYGGSASRGAGFFGAEASTNFWRVYGFRSKLLDVNRVRHIMTPEVRYMNVYSAEPRPSNFIHFDEIDQLDELQRLVVGVRNRFQTKRGPAGNQRTVDWVNMDVEHTSYLGNAGENARRHDFIEMDLTWHATDRVTFDSIGNEINLGTGELDIFNVGLQFQYSPRWRFYAGHRYVDTDPRRHIRGSSVAYVSAGYVFNEKWSAEVSQQYDYRANANQATRVVLTRQLPAWVLQVAFELNASGNNNLATFSLSPSGMRKGLFQF
ncbi:MAG: LPS-assembly protein LptD [Planctomycetes bacterium]|nr:LPS-assembly protein LptD [Planctomycetota bacterium]